MNRPDGKAISLWAIYAATAAGVFWLPFYVPPLKAMASLSQAFHFNNQFAIAALLGGMALATWWRWRDQRAEPSDAALSADQPLRCWPLLAAWAASVPNVILIWLASGWCPVEGSCYFVNRLVMAQDGLLPYQDFEFSYGPAMLYIPLAFQRLTGLSIHGAYLLTLLLFAWGGMFLLWWVVSHARASSRNKTVTFLLLAAVPALNPESGLQYMLMRYICGFAALLIALIARLAVEKLAGRWFLVALCHLILVGAVFSISQEVGLAFFAALIVYWLLEYRAGSRWLVYTAAITVGLMACLVLLAPRVAFLSVRVFASGGSSLPLFPSPYMLLYVGSLLLVIAPVLADGVRAALGQGPSRGVFGTLTPAFAVHAVAMIPAALGRADAGHVLYNGTGVFLLALLACDSGAPAIQWRGFTTSWRPLYRALFVLIFPVLSLGLGRLGDLIILTDLAKARIVEWSDQHPSSTPAQAVRKTLGDADWKRVQAGLANFHRNDLERLFPSLSRYGEICVPFGGPDIFYPLAVHHVLQTEYYYGITAESPVEEVRRKMEDVRSCRYAIIPGNVLREDPQPLRPDLTHTSRLLMFPIWGSPKILRPPAFEFWVYVRASFVPLRQLAPGSYLCQRRAEAP
jgi:hypothetical protein